MVETVLSRDKNWVRWKLEFCNQIRQAPIHSGEFNTAQNGAKRICKPTALRPSPMGALDLNFLKETDSSGEDEMQIDLTSLPNADTLVKDVSNADLDLEMAVTEAEKQTLQDAKMSKTWRALRLMSKTKLSLFDKVDDGRNLECFVQSKVEAMDSMDTAAEADDQGDDSQLEEAFEGQAKTDPVSVVVE
jgi:THO complex subunit 1